MAIHVDGTCHPLQQVALVSKEKIVAQVVSCFAFFVADWSLTNWGLHGLLIKVCSVCMLRRLVGVFTWGIYIIFLTFYATASWQAIEYTCANNILQFAYKFEFVSRTPACWGQLYLADPDSKGSFGGVWGSSYTQIRCSIMGKGATTKFQARSAKTGWKARDKVASKHDKLYCWRSCVVPLLSPINWMQYIVDNGLWHRLAGVDRSERHLVPKVWTKLWDNFEALNHHFSLSTTEFDRSTTAAVFAHGDEGLRRMALWSQLSNLH